MTRLVFLVAATVAGLWLISSVSARTPPPAAGHVGAAARDLASADATIGPLHETRVYEKTTLPPSYGDTRCAQLPVECVVSYKTAMSYAAILKFVKTLPKIHPTVLVFHHEPECGGTGAGHDDMPPSTFRREFEHQSNRIRAAAAAAHNGKVRVAMVACTYSYQEPYSRSRPGHDGAYPTCAFIPAPSYVDFYFADIYNFKPGKGNVTVNPSTAAQWEGWLKCVKTRGRRLGVAEYGLYVPSSTPAQRVKQLKADDAYFKTFAPRTFAVWSYFFEGEWTFTDASTIAEWKAIEAGH